MNPAAISPADTHKARKAYAFNYQNRPFLGRIKRESPFLFLKLNEKIFINIWSYPQITLPLHRF